MNLEIQRRAVAIAIRRVDLTRAALYAPVRPPQPGQRPAQFGPTAATNLLTALSALRNTQNNFLSVERGTLSLVALIPAMAGMMLGQRIRKRMSEALFRKVFFVFLLGLGLYIIINSLGAL